VNVPEIPPVRLSCDGDADQLSSVQQLFDLTLRGAIATGAGSGLGAVFAEALAESGERVVCAGPRITTVERTEMQLRVQDNEAIAIASDVTDVPAFRRMVEQTIEHPARYSRYPSSERTSFMSLACASIPCNPGTLSGSFGAYRIDGQDRKRPARSASSMTTPRCPCL
jgi:NAD(P)-dependent dehydrogenase (short-subunit alcohol dehydrogenase family)